VSSRSIPAISVPAERLFSHAGKATAAFYGTSFLVLLPPTVNISQPLSFPGLIFLTLRSPAFYSPAFCAQALLLHAEVFFVITKMRNHLSDSSTKAVLLIKSRTGHPEAESWETDMEHKAEDMMRDVVEDSAIGSNVDSSFEALSRALNGGFE
jgi:hypothetical protein